MHSTIHLKIIDGKLSGETSPSSIVLKGNQLFIAGNTHINLDQTITHANAPILNIVIKKQSHATIIHHIHAHTEIENKMHLTLENGSYLDYIGSPLNTQNSTDTILLNNSAHFRGHYFANSSQQNILLNLNDENASCELRGLFFPETDHNQKINIEINHYKPRSTSNILFKGIAKDQGRGKFKCKTIIHPGAQETKARQLNKNILLSDHATIESQPELEVYADNVSCSHGSTVGQMNESELFYLRSRGFSEKEAKKALIHAFIDDIIQTIPDKTVAKLASQRLFKEVLNEPL